MATIQKQAVAVNTIIELKRQGIAQSDIAEVMRSMNIKPPSAPTIRKYYNMDDAPTASELASPYQKEKAFDHPKCRPIIIRTLEANKDNKSFRVSSLYDLLEELLVDTGEMEKLPGNQQTLRNYCSHLRRTGQVSEKTITARLFNYIEDPPPGYQVQLDYGVQKLNGGESVHFICIVMRRSRLLFVKGQDHQFNAIETCQAIHLFFLFIGGRITELVIDQDSCMVFSEILGEIIETKDFKAFIDEQGIKLRVLHKADPLSKGSVENSVGFVKKNYFSCRLNLPAQKLIAGLPGWYTRKNTRRLNDATHRIPWQHFLEEEKGTLRPLVPSHYGGLASLVGPVSIDKTRTFVYRTNKYSVPPEFRFKAIHYRISGGMMNIYADESATRLVRRHPVAPPEVKHKVFIHQDDKRMPSTKWQTVKQTLLRSHRCPSMLHFLNGVCRENPHYRGPQLSAILSFLEKNDPEPQFLEEVLTRCCDTFSYKMSQFESIYRGIERERREWTQENLFCDHELDLSQTIRMPNGVEVQVRPSNSYQEIFERKVQETAGGAT
jgi:hypothetical protein